MAFKIYTKTGDQGQTGLFGGQRRPKSDLRIEAYGTLDEANAFIGMLRDCISADFLKEELLETQNQLFSIGSLLATPPDKPAPVPAPQASDIELLEAAIDRMEEYLEQLRSFILPGGHPIVSYAHIARTVVRRAERAVVELHLAEPVDPAILQYLNRLSDYLFVLARALADDLDIAEIPWTPRQK
jgi:cob(I)alamin adenosyltransferase